MNEKLVEGGPVVHEGRTGLFLNKIHYYGSYWGCGVAVPDRKKFPPHTGCFVPFSIEKDERSDINKHSIIPLSAVFPILPDSSSCFKNILCDFAEERVCNFGYCRGSFGYLFKDVTTVVGFFDNHTQAVLDFYEADFLDNKLVCFIPLEKLLTYFPACPPEDFIVPRDECRCVPASAFNAWVKAVSDNYDPDQSIVMSRGLPPSKSAYTTPYEKEGAGDREPARFSMQADNEKMAQLAPGLAASTGKHVNKKSKTSLVSIKKEVLRPSDVEMQAVVDKAAVTNKETCSSSSCPQEALNDMHVGSVEAEVKDKVGRKIGPSKSRSIIQGLTPPKRALRNAKVGAEGRGGGIIEDGSPADGLPYNAPVIGSNKLFTEETWRFMKAAGWSLKWDDKLTECFVFPEALQRFNNKSAIMNIEYFVERKCIEKHVDENPCLTAEVGSLISQLKVAGWKMIDVPKKEGEEAYKIFSYGVDNAIPGLQMFYNTASLKKFIHRFPYLLQEDVVLGDTLVKFGWKKELKTKNMNDYGKKNTSSNESTFWSPSDEYAKRYTLNNLKSFLWTAPWLVFSNMNLSESTIKEVLRVDTKDGDKKDFADFVEHAPAEDTSHTTSQQSQQSSGVDSFSLESHCVAANDQKLSSLLSAKTQFKSQLMKYDWQYLNITWKKRKDEKWMEYDFAWVAPWAPKARNGIDKVDSSAVLGVDYFLELSCIRQYLTSYGYHRTNERSAVRHHLSIDKRIKQAAIEDWHFKMILPLLESAGWNVQDGTYVPCWIPIDTYKDAKHGLDSSCDYFCSPKEVIVYLKEYGNERRARTCSNSPSARAVVARTSRKYPLNQAKPQSPTIYSMNYSTGPGSSQTERHDTGFSTISREEFDKLNNLGAEWWLLNVFDVCRVAAERQEPLKPSDIWNAMKFTAKLGEGGWESRWNSNRGCLDSDKDYLYYKTELDANNEKIKRSTKELLKAGGCYDTLVSLIHFVMDEAKKFGEDLSDAISLPGSSKAKLIRKKRCGSFNDDCEEGPPNDSTFILNKVSLQKSIGGRSPDVVENITQSCDGAISPSVFHDRPKQEPSCDLDEAVEDADPESDVDSEASESDEDKLESLLDQADPPFSDVWCILKKKGWSSVYPTKQHFAALEIASSTSIVYFHPRYCSGANEQKNETYFTQQCNILAYMKTQYKNEPASYELSGRLNRSSRRRTSVAEAAAAVAHTTSSSSDVPVHKGGSKKKRQSSSGRSSNTYVCETPAKKAKGKVQVPPVDIPAVPKTKAKKFKGMKAASTVEEIVSLPVARVGDDRLLILERLREVNAPSWIVDVINIRLQEKFDSCDPRFSTVWKVLKDHHWHSLKCYERANYTTVYLTNKVPKKPLFRLDDAQYVRGTDYFLEEEEVIDFAYSQMEEYGFDDGADLLSTYYLINKSLDEMIPEESESVEASVADDDSATTESDSWKPGSQLRTPKELELIDILRMDTINFNAHLWPLLKSKFSWSTAYASSGARLFDNLEKSDINDETFFLSNTFGRAKGDLNVLNETYFTKKEYVIEFWKEHFGLVEEADFSSVRSSVTGIRQVAADAVCASVNSSNASSASARKRNSNSSSDPIASNASKQKKTKTEVNVNKIEEVPKIPAPAPVPAAERILKCRQMLSLEDYTMCIKDENGDKTASWWNEGPAGRTEEFQLIFGRVRTAVENKENTALYISGNPGRGKSMCVNLTMQALDKVAHFDMVNVYSTGEGESSFYDSLIELLVPACTARDRRPSFADNKATVLKMLSNPVDATKQGRCKKMVVVIIDEVDKAPMHCVKELYDIASQDSTSSLVVIAMANNVNFLVNNSLSSCGNNYPLELKSTSKLEEGDDEAALVVQNSGHGIFFDAYTAEKLTAIMNHRLCGLFHPNAISLLVHRNVKAGGDVRALIRLFLACMDKHKDRVASIIEDTPFTNIVYTMQMTCEYTQSVEKTISTTMAVFAKYPVESISLYVAVLLHMKGNTAVNITHAEVLRAYAAFAEQSGLPSISRGVLEGAVEVLVNGNIMCKAGKLFGQLHAKSGAVGTEKSYRCVLKLEDILRYETYNKEPKLLSFHINPLKGIKMN